MDIEEKEIIKVLNRLSEGLQEKINTVNSTLDKVIPIANKIGYTFCRKTGKLLTIEKEVE